MQNKILNIEPIALSNVVGNLLNGNVTSLAGPVGITLTQPYILITHMRVTNNDSSTHTMNIYKGATGGSAVGTEIAKAYSVAPNASQDFFYGKLRLDAADFLSGNADAANKLTITIDAEIGFS